MAVDTWSDPPVIFDWDSDPCTCHRLEMTHFLIIGDRARKSPMIETVENTTKLDNLLIYPMEMPAHRIIKHQIQRMFPRTMRVCRKVKRWCKRWR